MADAVTISEAPAVLRLIWADPQHMPEHIALWSLDRFAPRAASAVGELRARQPVPERAELEQLVIERQTRVATTEGAFIGGPFVVLIPIAFCATLLAQAQMVFELATVAGRKTDDTLRAAELLVLLGAYPSTDEAATALETVPRDLRDRDGKRLPAGTRWAMVKRMAYLLEILGPVEGSRSRFRATLGWIGIGVLLLVGLVLPLVWVPYMAYSSRRSTLRMAVRARSFYADTAQDERAVTARQDQKVEVGGTAALLWMTLVVVVPIVVALVALLIGLSLFGGKWPTAGLVLIGVSAIATIAWIARPKFRTAVRQWSVPASNR